MRTTCIHLLQIMAAALTFTQTGLAQQIEQRNAIGETIIEPGSAIDLSQPGAMRGGNNESWRMINHNGRWWYYHSNGTWSSWDGMRWNPYQPATQKTGSEVATGTSARTVTGRHSGDVEVSGAQLGMGKGASRNSGLSNNPGSALNGKGGIGGTKDGAGLPGIGNRVRLPPTP